MCLILVISPLFLKRKYANVQSHKYADIILDHGLCNLPPPSKGKIYKLLSSVCGASVLYLGILHSVCMFIVYCVLCTVYCVLCTMYCVLCTVYCVLCTVYLDVCGVQDLLKEGSKCTVFY